MYVGRWLLFVAFVTLVGAAQGSTYIADNYIGADAYGPASNSNPDVIGSTTNFQIDGMTVSFEGSFIVDGNASYSIAVMVVHNRSLNGIETLRVQTKRLTQAESIAQMIQALQDADPDVHLVVTGDFNAFEFTDGYVDAVGHIMGDFDPSESILSGTDYVEPNLTNQVLNLPATDRYSYTY